MSDLDRAVAMFKDAAKKAGFYADLEAKSVILEKGKTLLIKTSRATNGRAIVNAR
jgi:hypothetical protein